MNLFPRAEPVKGSSLRYTGPGLFPPIDCAVYQTAEREDPALTVREDPALTVREDPVLTHEQYRKVQDNRGLLAELARIEQELRETLHREEQRQRELDKIRQEENQERWRSLCFLTLNQRTAKPWVTSYYRNIPMHIYCLPIETVTQQKRKRKKRKTKG